jgi:hypothetical protein
LSHRDHHSDVTAVCAEIDVASSPPKFKIRYSKNKSVLASGDLKRAEDLKILIQEKATTTSEEFCAAVFNYIRTHSTSKFQELCREFLSVAPKIIYCLFRLIKSDPNVKWQNKMTSKPGDVAIDTSVAREGISDLKQCSGC